MPAAFSGAAAASVVAARSASCRGVHPAGAGRTALKSRPSPMALVHRGSVRQPAEAVAPTTHHGLTRSRTSRAGSPVTPKKARARAMADAAKSLLVSVSRGATVSVASHRWHWKRRTDTQRISGAPSGVPGPRSCRERRPCPCSTTFPPAGWLAAPHAGQRAGRTSAAVGLFSAQVLTSRSLRMTP